MTVKQANRMAAFRVAGLFMALLACATVMNDCNQGYANAVRPLSGTLEKPPHVDVSTAQVPLPESNQTIDRQYDVPRLSYQTETSYAEFSDDALAEESFSGKITSLGDKQFVIKDDKDAEHTFKVNDDTKYTLDGNEAIFGELKVDYSVTVMVAMDGKHSVARMVDATSGK